MRRIGLVGRANVGKSSLFNALLEFRRSIVLDKPGTTLDLIREKPKWDLDLELIDTQGVFGEDEGIFEKINQACDAFVMVVDAVTGVSPFDRWLASKVLGTHKPVLLVVNKMDAKGADEFEFSELGFASVLAVSVVHRRGVEEVKAWISRGAGEKSSPDATEEKIQVALIGKPNTGKSTLMNLLCKNEISRVSSLPLTTRDPVGYDIQTGRGIVTLLDTAGLRRPRSAKEDLEIFSGHATTRMMRQADVVCLMVASHEGITDQDMRLWSLLQAEGRPVLILFNFWDRLGRQERALFQSSIEYEKLETVPHLFISSKTGWNTGRVLMTCQTLFKRSNFRVTTSRLNRLVEKMVEVNPPPVAGKGNFNILYASQVKSNPPTFLFFMNRKEALPLSYQRYLSNSLKERLRLKGQAVRLVFRAEGRT